MSLSGIILGLINIGIVSAVLVLVGAVIVWVMGLLQFPLPAQMQRIYLTIVALIALYLLVALIFGIPTVQVIDGRL
jgi:hypothetical protein